MTTMKAAVFNKKSKTEPFIIRQVEMPTPKINEVLIKIFAASVNAADYRSVQMHIVPKKGILGADVAGIIEAIGENCEQFKPGDEVMGDLANYGFGGFAEYAVAPEKALVLKPSSVSFEEAAALPLAGITALQALRNKGQIKAGQKVLIAGSGGGVGTFALQLAHYFGAGVDTVCGPKNVEQSKALGAIHVFDYSKEDFTKTDFLYDLIIAVNGNQRLSAYKKILNSNGIYVMVGGALSQIFRSLLFGRFFSFGSQRMYSLSAKSNQEDLAEIAKLAGEGKIKPIIDRYYSLDQTADAMQYASAGHACGKVIIKVG